MGWEFTGSSGYQAAQFSALMSGIDPILPAVLVKGRITQRGDAVFEHSHKIQEDSPGGMRPPFTRIQLGQVDVIVLRGHYLLCIPITMKNTYYEILQVSPKASPDIIKSAYTHIKSTILGATGEGSEDARNRLIFLEEAYSVLSSPEKRAAYDLRLSDDSAALTSNRSMTYVDRNEFSPSWWKSAGGRILMAGLFFAVVFSVYKFIGQRGEQKIRTDQVEIQARKEVGAVQNDAYRAETERTLVHGAVQNQDKVIDRSYEIASREADRRRTELEYRANAGAQQLEMQRQRQEAMLQDQRWRQEQYEKDRQAREAKALAEAPKRQLCNMYALNGNTREAQAAGCNRY